MMFLRWIALLFLALCSAQRLTEIDVVRSTSRGDVLISSGRADGRRDCQLRQLWGSIYSRPVRLSLESGILADGQINGDAENPYDDEHD